MVTESENMAFLCWQAWRLPGSAVCMPTIRHDMV